MEKEITRGEGIAVCLISFIFMIVVIFALDWAEHPNLPIEGETKIEGCLRGCNRLYYNNIKEEMRCEVECYEIDNKLK